MNFSPAEQSFTQDFNNSSNHARLDGRYPLSFRDIIASTSLDPARIQTLLGTEGCVSSASVDIGTTSVWAATRAEIVDSNESDVQISIEASPAFPSSQHSHLDHLASFLTILYGHLPLSLASQLQITPLKKWKLFLIILPISVTGGNVMDAASWAARLALSTIKLPKIQPFDSPDQEISPMDSFLKAGISGKHNSQYELDSSAPAARLKGLSELPVGITLGLIKQSPVADLTVLEESLVDAFVSFGIGTSGDILASKMLGEGELDISRLLPLTITCQQLATTLIPTLNTRIQVPKTL